MSRQIPVFVQGVYKRNVTVKQTADEVAGKVLERRPHIERNLNGKLVKMELRRVAELLDIAGLGLQWHASYEERPLEPVE